MSNRIAILMPNLHGGGAERVAVNLANELAARGHRVDMVLMRSSGELLDALVPQVRVVSLGAQRARKVLRPLVRYLGSEQPNALLANMWPLTVIAVLAKHMARVRTRVVVAEHTTWSHSELLARATVGWQVRTSIHHVFPRADGIVAVSQGAADDLAQFARLDPQSIQVIYNPVVGLTTALQLIGHHPADWWHGSHQRVLAVGTLKPIKSFQTLINAFSILRAGINVRLLILGEGGERAALEAQLSRLGLREQVFLPGFVKDPRPFYERADLFVLSSNAEGFGNVLVEALAAGTPVVSTDCPSGPREILDNGRYGRLVPVGDVEALANAMAISLKSTNYPSELIDRAQHFSIKKATDAYERLLMNTS